MFSFFMDNGYKIGGGFDFLKKNLWGFWFFFFEIKIFEDGYGLSNGFLFWFVMGEIFVDELSFVL